MAGLLVGFCAVAGVLELAGEARQRIHDREDRKPSPLLGNLAVTQGGPPKKDTKRLLQIDPEDGRLLQEVSLAKVEHVGGVAQVDGELWILDAFFGSRYVLDAARPRSPRESHDEGDLPCSLPIAINAAGDDALWFVDAWAPWIVKTDLNRRLLDWSERPFGGFVGVAWDGEQLWAIDKANARICVIEKADTKMTSCVLRPALPQPRRPRCPWQFRRVVAQPRRSCHMARR